MGSITGNFNAAKNYKTQANVATAQGRAQQAAYDHKAGNLESEARSDTNIAAMNMERMSGNQNAATGAARVARGASGFTDAGSGMQAEIAAADAFERSIKDMALSNAVSDSNKRYAAETMRYQGGLAMQAAEDQATQFRRLGKSAQNAGWAELGVTALSMGAAGISNIGVDAKIPGVNDDGSPMLGADGKQMMVANPKYTNPFTLGYKVSNATSDIFAFSPGTVQSQSRGKSGDGLADLFNTIFGEEQADNGTAVGNLLFGKDTAKKQGKNGYDSVTNFLFGSRS